jgi:RNA polymerase sigma-70 factor (ECF subfamily)
MHRAVARDAPTGARRAAASGGAEELTVHRLSGVWEVAIDRERRSLAVGDLDRGAMRAFGGSPLPDALAVKTGLIRSGPPGGSRRVAAGAFRRLSDELLVVLVARSEELALAELYGRYGAIARGLAGRVLRDPSLAEDAVQEGFLAVWCSAARFVPERGNARTWILTLVHHRAVDLVRGGRGRERDPLELATNGAEDPGDEALSLIEERERVRRALRQLPQEFRVPLVLAYYVGMTQRELAERLGLPLGTIKSRMSRGHTRLRAALANEAAGC